MVKRTKSAPVVGPSQAVLDACAKLVAQVGERVAPGAKPLSTKDRQRTLKLRRGGRATARTLATIAAKRGLGELVPVDAMLRDIEYAERLEGLTHDVTVLATVLADLILQADGKAWGVAVQAYTVLKRFAANDTALAAQLEPVVGAFATKRARTKKEAATPPNVSPKG